MPDRYILDLYQLNDDGISKLVLRQPFYGPCTADVLPMVTNQTGYGDYALLAYDD